MGADRPRRGPARRVRPLSASARVAPQPDRLYGRQAGHRLRPRQARLLAETLPRLRFDAALAATPAIAFAVPPARLALEIGFGGGEHALALLAADPGLALIASEVFANGLCSLLSRLVADGEEATGALPPQLRVWDRDARLLLAALPDACLDLAVLMFPDPWPKARHAKRRFVHPANLASLARTLRPGGHLRIASDDPTYQDWVDAVMAGAPAFVARGRWDRRPAGWPATRYEAKAIRAGRPPLWWEFGRA